MRRTHFKNIPVEVAYQQAASAIAQKFGRKQKDVVQRLIVWLDSQPPEVQAAFLGTPGSKIIRVEIDPLKIFTTPITNPAPASSPEPSPKFIPAKMERIPGPTVTHRKRESSKTQA